MHHLFKSLLVRLIYFTIGVLMTLYINPVRASEAWSCTGFFINSEGYLATADHCVKDGKAFYAYYNQRYYQMRVIARDPWKDAAILKIEAHTPYLRLNPAPIQSGQALAVFGYPLAVETLRISVGTGKKNFGLYNALSLNMLTCKGNSGSPVLDQQNRVVGILTEGVSDYTNQGKCSRKGYAPSVEYLIRLAQRYHITYYQNDLLPLDTFGNLYIRDRDNQVIIRFTGEN